MPVTWQRSSFNFSRPLLLKFMMKKSPSHQQSEACYYEVCGFDLHNNGFSQLLEGAKKNVSSSSVHAEEYGKRGSEKVKKEKKSWKRNLKPSWWKGDMKRSVLKFRKREIPYMSLHQQNLPRGGHSYGPLYVVT
ncbi:unnamed protein product [Sphenostylis stenocarpa]|uniref:Uncharacterized protein n=1 Tax=Sphenostylis stenocarpa TaxID=92480 RepID=A0AA86T032_9FABA|nr:unnamed protein product [Sphenostylis stenocarpa]